MTSRSRSGPTPQGVGGLKCLGLGTTPLCIQTTNDCSAANDSDFFTAESPLHQLGYNVIAGKLTEKERQTILVKIYEKKWLTFFQIQRDLEKAIRIFQYRSHYQAAVMKWKSDLYFISEYVKNQQFL